MAQVYVPQKKDNATKALAVGGAIGGALLGGPSGALTGYQVGQSAGQLTQKEPVQPVQEPQTAMQRRMSEIVPPDQELLEAKYAMQTQPEEFRRAYEPVIDEAYNRALEQRRKNYATS